MTGLPWKLVDPLSHQKGLGKKASAAGGRGLF